MPELKDVKTMFKGLSPFLPFLPLSPPPLSPLGAFAWSKERGYLQRACGYLTYSTVCLMRVPS
eukprot:1070999-Rhodomonas_salina.3